MNMKSRKPKIIEKPWGREIWLAEEPEYLGKILELRKGERSSLQYHKEKKETMYVLKGRLKIMGDKEEIVLEEGDSITLNPGDVHRLLAEEDVTIIEVSTYHPEDV
ncbi:MAG: cupin domain-containing protein, partial [Candidatus Altiarchaeota archaeon]|nr:cupin domain-containing protein [Candidatus Altiarchaeota archaeon]